MTMRFDFLIFHFFLLLVLSCPASSSIFQVYSLIERLLVGDARISIVIIGRHGSISLLLTLLYSSNLGIWVGLDLAGGMDGM